MTERKYTSLREFYPYYLSEHSNATCRTLHFVGTFMVFCILFWGLFTQTWWGLAFIPLTGYGFAWVGHFFFEKNKPATFQYPIFSLASDFMLFFDMLTKKQPFNPNKHQD
ncbi:MAG: DUF962 domain-containing protein [Cyclobacteriaceae bacterium]|nr:DUF962 domain-containing protein [Cyclobacteriaceae bacterium]